MSRFPPGPVRCGDLVLRPPTLDDAPDVAHACRDDLIQRWLPLARDYDLADARFFVDDFAPGVLREGSGIVFVIDAASEPDLAAAGRRLLGAIDLKATNWSTRCTEIGYWAAPWARGRGVATRATRRLAEWALREHGLERVALRAAVDNSTSRSVALRAGFVFEGIQRNSEPFFDDRIDFAVYSLIPADLR